MTTCLLLLAAGAARRMRGADKLLEPVEGVPVLRRLAVLGCDAGLQVRVALPSLAHPRARLINDLDVTPLVVPDAEEGMAASIRRGMDGLVADAVMILPADMPEITDTDLSVIARADGAIVQATAEDGTPGHPVRFDAQFFAELGQLTGDQGARAVLRAHASQVVRVALPGQHATIDLDTPEDWAAWRAGQAAQ
ncbi:nucleotidyltransferase family protein [Roseobacteraceae bacterium S113]